jgi:hypothetical protein
MHPKQVTPAGIIVNAVLVGLLAWFGIFVLRLLPYFEPVMVDSLCRLSNVQPYCSLHAWHSFDESWYVRAMAAFHPVVILVAAACSAIRDLLLLRFLI